MRITTYILIILALFASCNINIGVLKSARIKNNEFYDTIIFQESSILRVIDARIDGVQKKLVFDTGADLIALNVEDSKSGLGMYITDANGKKSHYSLNRITNFELLDTEYFNLYSVGSNFPEPILCIADGILGNTVIKSINVLIEQDKLVISDNLIEIENIQAYTDMFYYGSNRLHSNITLNNIKLDSCLIDYGGNFGFELPLRYYKQNISNFNPLETIELVSLRYSLNGVSEPDTFLRVNCNIDFNGILIKNVNIDFRTESEKRIGFQLLKRFDKVLINNTSDKLIFGEIIDSVIPINSIYSFDLVNDTFIVLQTSISEDFHKLNIGDKIIEINNRNSDSFNDYCEFFNWKYNLNHCETIVLKSDQNTTIKVNNIP